MVIRLCCLLTIAVTLAALPAVAQVVTVPAPVPTVPGGEIFGFTSPTDVGNAGERSLSLENTTWIGRREGRYLGSTLKIELGITPAENLFLAVSPFVSAFRIHEDPTLQPLSRIGFDGLSTEVQWRFLPRTASGLAATVALEPRWARFDGISGQRVEAFAAELKLFMDAVLVPDRWYAGVNLNWAPGVQRDAALPGTPYATGSGTSVSAALTYQANESLFFGAELRYLSAFEGAFLNRNLGNALYLGPTMLVRLNERADVNVAWTPQIAGRSRPSAGALDLDNFDRHQLRVKTSFAF